MIHCSRSWGIAMDSIQNIKEHCLRPYHVQRVQYLPLNYFQPKNDVFRLATPSMCAKSRFRGKYLYEGQGLFHTQRHRKLSQHWHVSCEKPSHCPTLQFPSQIFDQFLGQCPLVLSYRLTGRRWRCTIPHHSTSALALKQEIPELLNSQFYGQPEPQTWTPWLIIICGATWRVEFTRVKMIQKSIALAYFTGSRGYQKRRRDPSKAASDQVENVWNMCTSEWLPFWASPLRSSCHAFYRWDEILQLILRFLGVTVCQMMLTLKRCLILFASWIDNIR